MHTPQTNTAPTETDIKLVRKTFDLVVPIAGVAADLFYERLFYIAPSLRPMFPEDMRDQKRKLMVMLAMAVHSLTDLDALVPKLMELGARHVGYGVKDSPLQGGRRGADLDPGARARRRVHARGRARLGARLSAGRRHDAGRRRRSRHHAGGGMSSAAERVD